MGAGSAASSLAGLVAVIVIGTSPVDQEVLVWRSLSKLEARLARQHNWGLHRYEIRSSRGLWIREPGRLNGSACADMSVRGF